MSWLMGPVFSLILNKDSDADGVNDKFDANVNTITTAEQTAGQTAQTIDMYYTAVGSTAGVLSGGSLVLDIPPLL